MSNYASPPCYQHEVVSADENFMSGDEVVRLLNSLLEGERAGARALRELVHDVDDSFLKAQLREVARDEADFCAMIRFDVAPSRTIGPFYEKLKGMTSLSEKIELLNRGQISVVRTLDAAIPRIERKDLRADLTHMRDVHQVYTEACVDPKLGTNT